MTQRSSNHKSLMGVVLCGGESNRMGADRGLLPINDSIWAVHVGCKLQLLGIPIVYSINPRQEESYARYIQKNALIVDEGSAEGPLRGLLSVRGQYPHHDFFVLACDMLDISRNTLQLLLDTYRTGSDNFFAFKAGEFYEPLCAIYTSSGLLSLNVNDSTKTVLTVSLQSILQKGKTKSLQPLKNEAFRNYNTPG